MFFKFSSALLKEDNEIALSLFIRRYEDGRIFLEFDDVRAAEDWIATLSRPFKERWAAIVKHSVQLGARFNLNKMYPAGLIIKVDEVRSSVWKGEVIVTIEDALYLIDQSIKLALENSRNDLFFLKTLLPAKQRDSIDVLIGRGHLEVLGGGNGELKKVLELKAEDNPFRILSWTLFDSDATEPGEIKKATQALIDVCEKYSLVYHCLSRRAIENYIDRDVYLLAHDGRLNDNAKMVYSLSESQISHFNMKEGLSDTEKRSSLYKDLPEEVLAGLQGFGGRFASRTFSRVDLHEGIHQIYQEKSTLGEFGSKLHHLASLLGRPV
ncbi:hypothetical protein [Pseudomonas azotoformans]|uniref:Uncharacterized protein n=1 Tax=Pseudomonas azotoformans TaxID=47878 RepID=A0A127HQJ7_PSEAZ|nr:hypothetical protein [Pseudomonas azotoformans]AMN76872.1 hypothetical protein AYR47_00345 [Pseudomonas azotoformans]